MKGQEFATMSFVNKIHHGDCEEILGDISRAIVDIANNLALSEERKVWGAGISVSDERTSVEPFLSYRIKTGGKERTYGNYDHVMLQKGEKFEIVDLK